MICWRFINFEMALYTSIIYISFKKNVLQVILWQRIVFPVERNQLLACNISLILLHTDDVNVVMYIWSSYHLNRFVMQNGRLLHEYLWLLTLVEYELNSEPLAINSLLMPMFNNSHICIKTSPLVIEGGHLHRLSLMCNSIGYCVIKFMHFIQ